MELAGEEGIRIGDEDCSGEESEEEAAEREATERRDKERAYSLDDVKRALRIMVARPMVTGEK
eukprot:jgi/Chrpa1/26830/Chrysochromulina_OHIO_Genome00026746-RA